MSKRIVSIANSADSLRKNSTSCLQVNDMITWLSFRLWIETYCNPLKLSRRFMCALWLFYSERPEKSFARQFHFILFCRFCIHFLWDQRDQMLFQILQLSSLSTISFFASLFCISLSHRNFKCFWKLFLAVTVEKCPMPSDHLSCKSSYPVPVSLINWIFFRFKLIWW